MKNAINPQTEIKHLAYSKDAQGDDLPSYFLAKKDPVKVLKYFTYIHQFKDKKKIEDEVPEDLVYSPDPKLEGRRQGLVAQKSSLLEDKLLEQKEEEEKGETDKKTRFGIGCTIQEGKYTTFKDWNKSSPP